MILENNELMVEKNERERLIPLSTELESIYKITFDSHSSKDAIFITNSGDRITERAVQYMLKKYHVNPNKLRHTFCQKLVDNNII